MAYIAVDKDGEAYIFDFLPTRRKDVWLASEEENSEFLNIIHTTPKVVRILAGKDLSWNDEPVEI